jgi:hypothetical protein
MLPDYRPGDDLPTVCVRLTFVMGSDGPRSVRVAALG